MYDYIILKPPLDDYLEHHGVKGMRWGHRKQKYSVKTYNKYKKAGMSKEEAKNQAIKKRRIAKIIGISAGVAAAGLAAYGTYKFMNSPVRKDIVLRAGTKMQTLSATKDLLDSPVHDFHYAAFKKADKTMYKAVWGKPLGMFGLPTGDNKFNLGSKIVKESKIASQKTARDIFKNLVSNDSDFRNAVKIKDVSKMSKRDWKRAHLAFDSDLVNMHGSDVSKKYFEKLKSLGYSGVVDANDLRGSGGKGLKTKAPVIMFDKSSYVKDSVVSKIADKDIAKAQFNVAAKAAVQGLLPYGVAGAGAVGISSAAKYDNRVISKYKQQNKKKASK